MTAARDALHVAFQRIERWLRDNGSEEHVRNLAEGASPTELDNIEATLGFSIGAELRALWSLHDGQRAEGHDIFEWPFRSARQAASDPLTSQLRFMRDAKSAPWLPESGLTDTEVGSDAWLRFAGLDRDGIAVNTTSGRVFGVAKDVPPLRLAAPTLAAWLAAHAGRLEAGELRIVEDEHGNRSLVRVDREAERREAERAAKAKTAAAAKDATAPATLLAAAIKKADSRGAYEALERARRRSPATYSQCIDLLFETASPAFIASASRLLLDKLELSKERWTVIAADGVELENNAIVAFANKRAATSDES